MAAQVSHLVMEQVRQTILDEMDIKQECPNLHEWLLNPYLYVHAVGNKESLEFLLAKAKTLGVPTFEWRDTVYVSIGDKKEAIRDVLVGFSFEACDADRVKAVIGTLPML
jgi:hypothetical protein